MARIRVSADTLALDKTKTTEQISTSIVFGGIPLPLTELIDAIFPEKKVRC